MAWYLDTNRIYVQEFDENSSQIAPRLQPLSGGSIIQSFGYDSTTHNLSFLIVGDTIRDTLRGYSKDGMSAHVLTTPEEVLSGWMVKSFKASRTKSTCQTIDISQPEDAPVYDCQIELWKED